MNKKDLTVMYATVFWCLLFVLLDFLALLHNPNYSLHKKLITVRMQISVFYFLYEVSYF